MDGGKAGACHRIATFAPQMMAANTRRATELTLTRREQAGRLPLRRIRDCTAGVWGIVAEMQKIYSPQSHREASHRHRGKYQLDSFLPFWCVDIGEMKWAGDTSR